MNRTPTGRLFRTGAGSDLVLTRTFRAPIEDVWASITESERTARWYGPWEGIPAPGQMIKVRLAYEDGQPWMDMRIDACEPPQRLALSATDEYGDWRLEAVLSEAGGSTELRFVQRQIDENTIGDVGPGWEYYLDMLAAAREGSPLPEFGDYYPAMKPYFEGLREEP